MVHTVHCQADQQFPLHRFEDNSGTPALATGIAAAEVRTAIGAGTSSFDGLQFFEWETYYSCRPSA